MVLCDMQLTLSLQSAILFEMFVFDLNKNHTSKIFIASNYLNLKLFHFYLAHLNLHTKIRDFYTI